MNRKIKQAFLFVISLGLIFSCNPVEEKTSIQLTISAEGALTTEETEEMDKVVNILFQRLTYYGIAANNIDIEIEGNKIHLQIEGLKKRESIEKLITYRGQIEFRETYRFSELYDNFQKANQYLFDIQNKESHQKQNEIKPAKVENESSAGSKEEKSLLEELEQSGFFEKLENLQSDAYFAKHPLYSVLNPNVEIQDNQYIPAQMATVGFSNTSDTSRVKRLLDQCTDFFPKNVKFIWMNESRLETEDILGLLAIKIAEGNNYKSLNDNAIVDARQDYDENGNPEINIKMNEKATRQWEMMTSKNVGRQIAIVIDEHVYMAPIVTSMIENGISAISNLSLEDARYLAYVLKTPALPCKLKIEKQ